MILGGDTTAARGETGETAASLKKAGPEEYIDQERDIIEWAVAPVPHDAVDALLWNSWRRVSPDRRKRFGKPPQSHCGKPTVDLGGHEPSPSR